MKLKQVFYARIVLQIFQTTKLLNVALLIIIIFFFQCGSTLSSFPSASYIYVYLYEKLLNYFLPSGWSHRLKDVVTNWTMKLLHILLLLVYLKISTNSEQKTQCRFKVALLSTPPYIMSGSLDPGFMYQTLNGLWTWLALVDKQATRQLAIWIPSLCEVKVKCQIWWEPFLKFS